MAECFFGSRRHALNAVLIAHVEFECHCAGADDLNFGCKCGKGTSGAAGENQICASPCKRACELLTESATRSGDNRHSTRQIEEWLSW
jgi:hypothetical protein